MKKSLFAGLLGLGLSLSVLAPVFVGQPAQAQSVRTGDGFTGGFDVFTDRRGRRFLVDPETGEVVGRVNPNARFTARDQAQAQRALRRVLRRARLNGEIGSLFGLLDRDEPRRQRPQRRERSLFGEPQPGTQRFQDGRRERVQRQPLAPLTREEEVARLPQVQQTRRPSALSGMAKPNYSKAQMAALQVVLDRAGFSPGVIDGAWGSNVAKAAASWRESTGRSDDLGNAATLERLVTESGGDVFVTYTITAKDVRGPFARSIPADFGKKAQLERLSYTSVVEMLAEKFHMSKGYLRALNPGKNFNRAGTTIKVVKPGAQRKGKVHYIVADKGRKQVRAFDRNGKLVAAYPATIGSAATPSPTGTHSVERIALNPEYTYNPKKNFQQGNNDKILRIAPGPNGPVGSVWIALSKPTYGIHGTPDPEAIGKTNSNGCIRLTNWDATELAKMVSKGVTVEFVE
ncbi:MAG: L,D-transpeptidase [Pseudomonadota bacterium]